MIFIDFIFSLFYCTYDIEKFMSWIFHDINHYNLSNPIANLNLNKVWSNNSWIDFKLTFIFFQGIIILVGSTSPSIILSLDMVVNNRSITSNSCTIYPYCKCNLPCQIHIIIQLFWRIQGFWIWWTSFYLYNQFLKNYVTFLLEKI